MIGQDSYSHRDVRRKKFSFWLTTDTVGNSNIFPCAQESKREKHVAQLSGAVDSDAAM